jgi:hypothetical protein
MDPISFINDGIEISPCNCGLITNELSYCLVLKPLIKFLNEKNAKYYWSCDEP